MLRAFRNQPTRLFSTASARMFAQGAKIPAIESLREASPGDEVDLAELTKTGKSLIVTIPGAYSPACSGNHVPGYVKKLDEFKAKGFSNIFVTAVNDAFVMHSWGKEIGGGVSGIRFIADPQGEFGKAAGLLVDDAIPFFGNARSKRSVIVVENGVVSKEIVEPDGFGVSVTAADEVLKAI